MSENLISAYDAAVTAVRTYAELVQAEPTEQRPALLFLADDIREGEAIGDGSLDCLATGSAPQLFELLANAGQESPRIACAIVVAAEREELTRLSLDYIAQMAEQR